jgi:hypothetical protein
METTLDNLTVDPANSGTLSCESCGAEFTCSAGQETCWCFDVKVAPENLDALKENYQRCLCKECLEKLDANK